MTLTLVIATLGDQGTLRACLDGLASQLHAPTFEVVIVDQNEDSRVAAILPEFAGRLDIRHERVAFRGACRARNHGARLGSGEWLGFPDDDCIPAPDALAEFEKVRASKLHLKVITGRTVDETGASNILRWAEAERSFTPFSMFSSVTEATLFVEKQAFAAVGGFDERFGPGTRYPAAEGVELVNRLFSAEGEEMAYFSPAIRMQHPTKVPPFTAWAAKRFHVYAIGDGAMIAKSPQPHILMWGLRTCVSASIQVFSLPLWRSAAFAGRLAGLMRGFVRFHLDSLRKR